jgi:hypothetical protein
MEIIGKKIVKIRYMNQSECDREGWYQNPNSPILVLELDCGGTLFPSCDYEGNGGGAIFGASKTGETLFVDVTGRKKAKKTVDTSQMDNNEFGKFIRGECV